MVWVRLVMVERSKTLRKTLILVLKSFLMYLKLNGGCCKN